MAPDPPEHPDVADLPADLPRGDPPPRRRTPNVPDLLRSLVPLTALILLVAWLYSPNDPAPVPVVDPAPELAYAATLTGFDVLGARGLPAGWRATSAALAPRAAEGPHTVRVGYVTPGDAFAQVVQSDRPRDDLLDEVLGEGVLVLRPVDVAGLAWDGLRTSDGETALVRAQGRSTVVVTGSAPVDVLDDLAAALRPVAP